MLTTNMKKFNLFIICIIINILFSEQKLEAFEIEINTTTVSEGFYIKDEIENSQCKQWIPSLFTPILSYFLPDDPNQGTKIAEISLTLKIPYYNHYKETTFEVFKNINFLKNDYKGILMKSEESLQNKCYFGISPGISGYEPLTEDNTVLNTLKTNSISKKIFSFDIWKINSENDYHPKSWFYLGESNNMFSSYDKLVATCDSYTNDMHWGCSFKEMIFNNINIPIKYSNQSLYKIYFSSETHNIIFPNDFEGIIANITNEKCKTNNKGYLTCDNFFSNSNYVPLRLTEENDKFTITGQVDNIIRFNSEEEKKKNDARITFEDIDYIILPLSVFKKFHLQFDAEKKLINFYSNDSEILQVKESENGSSFSGLIITILVILILLVLGIGIYFFFMKRRKLEKNINNFSKFEDEEDYQNMNEKKVF